MIECRAAFIRNIFVCSVEPAQRKKRLFSAAATHDVCITRECGAQLAANVIILRVRLKERLVGRGARKIRPVPSLFIDAGFVCFAGWAAPTGECNYYTRRAY
jgi:hypothetical protein